MMMDLKSMFNKEIDKTPIIAAYVRRIKSKDLTLEEFLENENIEDDVKKAVQEAIQK